MANSNSTAFVHLRDRAERSKCYIPTRSCLIERGIPNCLEQQDIPSPSKLIQAVESSHKHWWCAIPAKLQPTLSFKLPGKPSQGILNKVPSSKLWHLFKFFKFIYM